MIVLVGLGVFIILIFVIVALDALENRMVSKTLGEFGLEQIKEKLGTIKTNLVSDGFLEAKQMVVNIPDKPRPKQKPSRTIIVWPGKVMEKPKRKRKVRQRKSRKNVRNKGKRKNQ